MFHLELLDRESVDLGSVGVSLGDWNLTVAETRTGTAGDSVTQQPRGAPGRRLEHRAILLFSVVVALLPGSLSGADTAATETAATETAATETAAIETELKTKVWPMLAEHCLDCHSGAEPAAGLTLDHMDSPLAFLKGRSLWEKAVQKMQIQEMPPPDVSSLTEADRSYLIDWIRSAMDDYECGLAPNPGQVTLRRLNATEYQNTIRDLIGLNYTPAASFPGDDIGYGFDNIGDVLTLPPLLMEKYFLAAEKISQVAIQAPPPARRFETSYAGGQLLVNGKTRQGNRSLTLSSNSNATFQEQIPWAGSYQLTVTAAGDQAGSEPCEMGISVDGKLRGRRRVKNQRNSPEDFTITLRLRAGSRKIGLHFLNDFYVAAEGGRPKQDRNLILEHVALAGQKSSREQLDPNTLSRSHRAIIFTAPTSQRDAELATRQVIDRLASRAFRRIADRADGDRLVALAMSVQNEGDSFEESIRVALQAILISPKFLFRVEPPSAGTPPEKTRDLDDFELATRLSYFLWSSMPDDQLLQLAMHGQLRASDNLEKQVKRMITHKHSKALVENFAGQWLTLRKLREFKPNERLYPKWNDRVRRLVEHETMAFFAGVMRGDMSVLRLLDGDFTYMNEELAEFYGIPGVQGDHFRLVSLAGTPRGGLLTQASILAVTSNPTRTSPVRRGKWILDNLLATPPPPAPPGVPELEEKGELSGSLRSRLEQHRSDPACANCHKLMDPLGFSLENFDAIGQYRTHERGTAIDASGQLPDGSVVRGADELRETLLSRNQDQFVRCLTEKMLTYALGRGLEYYDQCAVDKIVEELEKNDYRFGTLLMEIVRSDPFQKKGQREIQ